MTHSTKVIHLSGFDPLNQADEITCISQVSIVECNLIIDMINSMSINKRRTAYNAMNFISFFKEKFCKVRAVLSCNTCD